MNISHFRSLALKGALVIATLTFLLGIVGTAPRAFASSSCYSLCIGEYPIPTANSVPEGITRGPNGSLWFTELNGNKIGTLSSSGVIDYSIPTLNSWPDHIILGPDGNLWFTEFNGNKIGVFNPTTDKVVAEYSIPTANSKPYGIASDGTYLWFTENQGNQIGVALIVNGTLSGLSETPIPTANSAPVGITADASVSAAFTESNGNQIAVAVPNIS
jgi:virginiamycin B lyase